MNNSTELKALRAIFQTAGFDLWFVGGCVRDSLLGLTPKDIDLCTDATPEEQVAVYESNDVRFVPTGLQHGTVTVVLDEPYEITSLRTESDHDGRWATMAYTRDLTEDLSRRDLTINAMAMDFDGNLIDPFGGQADLEARRVRFVGDAAERMREDYLRILRFFRFHGRIAGSGKIDAKARKAIRETRGGLGNISVERVWMEMSKIITGPEASNTLKQMRRLMVLDIVGMPAGMEGSIQHCREMGVTDPAAVMGCYVLDEAAVDHVADRWKWSKQERDRATFVARERDGNSMDRWKEMLVDGVSFDWVSDLMRMNGVDPQVLVNWEVPTFPVNGGDLIKAGMAPGKQMGEVLDRMTRVWKDSDYTATKQDLMSSLAMVSE
jgi:tRNA nucleotidyltransferase (CCA-adding enzyme)